MSKALRLRAVVFAACVLLATYAASAGAGAEQRGKDHVPLGHPRNPETWYVLAESLAEQAKDSSLTPDAARRLVFRCLEVNEQALDLNPVYYDALTLKAALLRQRATTEKDASVRKKLIAESVRKKLIAEADVCSGKAAEIAKRRREQF